MVRRRGAALLAAVAVLVLGLGVLGGVRAASSAAAAAPTTSALDQVGACIAAGGRGDVLIVIDTSGSLKTTDPGHVRVDAAQYLVNELATFAESSRASVDVAVAGFDTGFHPGSGWTSIAGNAGPVKDSLQQYRTATGGLDTDYWAAVDGSRKALLAKAAEHPEQASCPVWFWFSDGQYDIDARKAGQLDRTGGHKPYAPGNDLSTQSQADAARQAGTADLCRAGGQADQSRSAGITTVAIGLEHENSDFTLMKRIAAGEPEPCGTLPARGQFVSAGQVDDLFFAFDQFATPGRAPISSTGAVCGGRVCVEGTHSFVVDSAIGSARVLASSDVDGAVLRLLSPAGGSIEIGASDGRAEVAGANAQWQWLSPSTAQVVIERSTGSAEPADGWSGQWRLVVVDPAADAPHGTSRASVHLSADVTPVWTTPTEVLTRSESAEIGLGLQRLDGTSLDPESLPSTLDLSAVLVGSDGVEVPVASDLGKGELAGTRTVDLSAVPIGSADVRLTLKLTTASATSADGESVPGTTLAPITTAYPVRILPAPNYPSVPETVNFGELEGVEPVTVSVPVTGPGCVWLGDSAPATTVPDGVTATLSSPSNSQADCSDGNLTLTLTPSAAGNGLISGSTTVMAVPTDGDGDPVAIPVQYQLELAKPANQPLRIAVFAAVLLAGLLLPVAALYALKWATARLQGSRVFTGVVRGPVSEHGSFLDTTAPPHLNDLDAAYITGSRRELIVPGARLRTVVGLAPTEPGHVLAQLAGPSASSGTPSTVRGAARLPLDVRNQWLVGLDALDPQEGPVEVIYVVSDEAQLPAVVADARRRVPERVRQLRSGLPATPGAAHQIPVAASPGPGDEWSASPSVKRPPQAGADDGW